MFLGHEATNKKPHLAQHDTPSQNVAVTPPSLYCPILLICALLLPSHLCQATSPLERLAEAVRFKTISFQDQAKIDYEAFSELNGFLEQSYPKTFQQLDVEYINTHSILLRWSGSDPRLNAVLFTAHTDVVPVEQGTEDSWQHPPFAGVIENDRLYGRGTLDDKQGVISLLEATESLLEQGFEPRRTLVFGFGHDEEIGGENGAAALATRMRELNLSFDWMVDEGGFVVRDTPLLPGRDIAMINVAEKGYVTLTLSTKAPGGHSSSPASTGAIGTLARALDRIERNPFKPKLVEPMRSALAMMAPEMDQPERFLLDNLWLFDGLIARQMAKETITQPMVRTTTALTMFNAGIKENVIPQRAEAKVNFRLLPGDSVEMLIEAVTDIVDDSSIVITNDRWTDRPGVADAAGNGFAVISAATAEVYPEALVVPSLLQATTDTRHYVKLAKDQYRFHGNSVGADQIRSVHGTNEYITDRSFNKAIAVARGMLIGAGKGL